MANTVMRFFYLVSVLLCACQQGSKQSSTIGAFGINPTHEGLPPTGWEYGYKMPYGEGLHEGIDYLIPEGTYIVAVSDGIVNFIGEPDKDHMWGGGYAVGLKHGDDFFSGYLHLSKVFVTSGQHIKRGQRLGLSGQTNIGFPHLHFHLLWSVEIHREDIFSKSLNPNDFWLSGSPQCFDPHKDYSKYSFKEITFPVACSESK